MEGQPHKIEQRGQKLAIGRRMGPLQWEEWYDDPDSTIPCYTLFQTVTKFFIKIYNYILMKKHFSKNKI